MNISFFMDGKLGLVVRPLDSVCARWFSVIGVTLGGGCIETRSMMISIYPWVRMLNIGVYETTRMP